MSRWFRVYDDLVDDPKVQRLPRDTIVALLNLWCLASQNGGALPSVDHIAFKLRTKPDKVIAVIVALVKAGLLDKTETGYEPHNWSKRQFKSDVSNERVKRYRERKCNVTSAVSETPPEADTESETEQIRGRESARSRATRLDPKWSPSPEDRQAAEEIGLSSAEIEADIGKFRDRYHARGETRDDWSAQWRLWCRMTVEKRPASAQTPSAPAAFVIVPGTPEWAAWEKHLRETGAQFRLSQMMQAANEGKSFPVPSRFPPAADIEAPKRKQA